MVYPIVTERSQGSRLWDVDGNEYVDMTNGFGSILFGHRPDFVIRALNEQMDKGFEIGPQSPLAGKVAELLCRMTGYGAGGVLQYGFGSGSGGGPNRAHGHWPRQNSHVQR